MTRRCFTLDQEAATDPAIAGAKAAGLAAARRAGLPVLPGVVVPVSASAAVTEAVAPALTEGNVGKARLAAMRIQPDDELLAELDELLSTQPAPLIVRSSSPLEADGTWSGAFSTFHDIAHDELGTAIRGCWGAAFSVGVLERAEQTATPWQRLGIAVLIQPELSPDLGGTARLSSDGSVRITATAGPLRPLMAGHVEGMAATVAPDGEVSSKELEDHAVLARVAQVTRTTGQLLGHHLIEWAAVDGEVVLLQSIRSHDLPTSQPSGGATDPALTSPVALRIAALTQRFAGKLGEELVLPWAVASDAVPDLPPATTTQDPSVALAEARAAANGLVAQLWGSSPRAAAAEADRVLRQLRGDEPAGALETIAQLASPSPEAMAPILHRLATVRDAMLRRGLLDSQAAFWRAGGDAIARALETATPILESRFGVERWEPFLHGVVVANGEQATGTPAAPGAGAGRAHVVTEGRPQPSPTGRYVIVASEPGPALGALLWNAAGLVTRAGSTAAHLIEFAHSIGVPTVVGCDLPELAPDDAPLLAVDGGSGTVSLVWAPGDRSAATAALE